MKDWYIILSGIILIIWITIVGTTEAIVHSNIKEYIQQLEQSLNEQIQEKEVYMKMLEEKDD